MIEEANMSGPTLRSKEEYTFQLKQKADALKARANLPKYFAPQDQQAKTRFYFLNRAAQVGEACSRAHDLPTPLFVLMRVLCEDLILLFWISLSEQNAAEYAKLPISEVARIARINLERGRAQIRHCQTGENATEKLLPGLRELEKKGGRVEQIAKDAGLHAVYDLLYRFGSLELHGKSFGLPDQDDERLPAALCAINALMAAITQIVDNPPQSLSAGDVLRVLGIPGSGANHRRPSDF
jgi:hypothetical protein